MGLQYFPLPPDTPCAGDADCGPPDPTAPPEWAGCRVPTVCAAPGALLGVAANLCAPATAARDCYRAGTSCVPLGQCSASGWRCTSVGRACDTGIAGDVCTAPPSRTCLSAALCNPALFRQMAVP